jgi:tellurite resistance protein
MPSKAPRKPAAKRDAEQSARLDLEAHAQSIRDGIPAAKQNEVFRAAVEAAYLTALADGEVDDDERTALVRAVEVLSEGAVIEWEAESLVDDCTERAGAEGKAARVEAVGKALSALGQAQAGLYVAAVVARASKGIDKQEADLLKAVGAAAGLGADAVKEIVKKAGSL